MFIKYCANTSVIVQYLASKARAVKMKPYILLATIVIISLTNGASVFKKRETEEKVRYDDYRVFKIKYKTPTQRQSLLDLTKIKLNVSIT